jgi:hypothetical protein
MTPAGFRRIALSLPEAIEASHMGHADFRVGGKIFATLGAPDEEHGAVMLNPDEQRDYVADAPAAFTPANGAWGKKGATHVRLEIADPALLASALEDAWRAKAPRRLTRPS